MNRRWVDYFLTEREVAFFLLFPRCGAPDDVERLQDRSARWILRFVGQVNIALQGTVFAGV
jgi:hypothetical protein